MTHCNKIEHTGVVDAVENGSVRVRILRQSACNLCSASAHCGSSETKETTLSLPLQDASSYQKGDNVTVKIDRHAGFRAVFVGFALPLLLLITSFCLTAAATDRLPLQAFVPIIVITSYYLILFLCRQKLNSRFAFEISKV